jgi:HEPN domain-containing protein
VVPLTMGVTVARDMAFNAETWSESGLRYVVIGDAGAAEVHELSELLKVAGRS